MCETTEKGMDKDDKFLVYITNMICKEDFETNFKYPYEYHRMKNVKVIVFMHLYRVIL